MPKKTNGPPIKENKGMVSENKTHPRKEATKGSPRGTEATAVGDKNLIA